MKRAAISGGTNLPPTENPSRERILERIRSGLRVPRADHVATESSDTHAVFPPIADPLQRFQQECGINLTECIFTADAAATAKALANVIESLPDGEIFFQDAACLRKLAEDAKLSGRRSIRWSSDGAPRETSQATVTLAEALIAQTGSVLVSSSCGGRGGSVIAPCHIVVGTRNQLVTDLETAMSNASRQALLDHNSFACVISGSSRTGDIEKILVQGAHGPRRLVVIIQIG